MPYLNIDLDYFTHPKTMRLVAILGPGAAEFPIRLWAYCAKHHAETGRLVGYTEDEVESATGWMGEKGKMAAAMLKLNFLEKIDDGYRIHDWLDHAGHLAAFKKRAKSAAKVRWRKYASSNTISTPKGKITNTPNLSSPLQPNLIKKKNKIRVAPPQEALELSQLLSDKIFENIPDRTPPTESQLMAWAHEVDLIHRVDGHAWDKIRELLLWSQQDGFWKANILSMSKFRKQWNQLSAKANGTGQSKADRLRQQTAQALKRGIP